MQYEPVKNTLGRIFNVSPWLRRSFYKLLDLLLLRTWYIHKELKKWNSLPRSHAQILDAGAGFGQYTYYLYRLNPAWDIFSIDLKQKEVDNCNDFFQQIGAHTVVFKTADLASFKKENTFDLVLCVDVIEHILEDTLVFRNLCTSLQPGGMLLLSTPSDHGALKVFGCHGDSFFEEHVHEGYNIKEMEQKLLAAGFSRVEVRYAYGFAGRISWYLSIKYPMLLLSASKLFFSVLPVYYAVVYPIAFVLNFLDVSINHTKGMWLIVKAWR